MVRIKSERELRWEKEHAEEIAESMRILKEQAKEEWAMKKKKIKEMSKKDGKQ
jgi:hypothetical protein